MKLTDRVGMEPASGFCAGQWLSGNRAGEMEYERGSAEWNEPGYYSRAVQPGLRAERADLSDRSR
jgi:hypothetical protein